MYFIVPYWTELCYRASVNGLYIPSSLGGRSFIVVRQSDENLAVSKNFKIWQL